MVHSMVALLGMEVGRPWGMWDRPLSVPRGHGCMKPSLCLLASKGCRGDALVSAQCQLGLLVFVVESCHTLH